MVFLQWFQYPVFNHLVDLLQVRVVLLKKGDLLVFALDLEHCLANLLHRTPEVEEQLADQHHEVVLDLALNDQEHVGKEVDNDVFNSPLLHNG